jgi:ABC-type glycerol-3-phosphate transport system substrate-binding protein
MTACKKLRAIGVAPYGIGDKDQYSGGELISYWGTQMYNSILDIWKPIIGSEKYTDPKHMFYWKTLEEMIKANVFNDDMLSLDHYQGHELFMRELAATTWTTQPELVRWEQQMGPDKVGVMQFPIKGTGKLADTVGGPVQVLGIPTLAKHPKEAALFFKFMHRPDRVKSMYEHAHAIAPTDVFNPAWIKSEVDKKVLEWIRTKPGPWYQYLYPTQFEAEIVSPNTSLMFAGTTKSEEAAKKCQVFMEKWRTDNPTLVQAFKDWMAEAEK